MLPYLFLLLLISTVQAGDYDSFSFDELANSEEHPDRVFNLPGAPSEPSFPLYSGYINVDTVDPINPDGEKLGNNVFYVLCESIRADPLEAPLVVWLNGGPGASSLIGFLLENGPYIVDARSDKLRYNDLSWNQYANVLYIETPTKVGYSRGEWPRTIDDEYTANLNMKVLQEFMNSVHPRYANRPFYITGESYAGVFVPFFARAVLSGIQDGNFTNENFKGIAMGNPVVDEASRRTAAIVQMFAMGMIPQKYGPKIFQQWQKVKAGEKINDYHFDDFELDGFYHNWIASLRVLSTVYNIALVCEENRYEEIWHIAPPTIDSECLAEEAIEKYMNRVDVQKSLHAIKKYDNKTLYWKMIERVRYRYSLCDDSVPIYKDIFAMAEDNFRVLFYSGDLDFVCPALHVAHGTSKIASANEMQEDHGSQRVWHYLGDFGGARTSYMFPNKNITMDVLTVRGAGHLVPINQPSRIFQVINNFLFSSDSIINYSEMIRRRDYFNSSMISRDLF